MINMTEEEAQHIVEQYEAAIKMVEKAKLDAKALATQQKALAKKAAKEAESLAKAAEDLLVQQKKKEKMVVNADYKQIKTALLASGKDEAYAWLKELQDYVVENKDKPDCNARLLDKCYRHIEYGCSILAELYAND
jgi:hypothetical protein